MRLEQYQKGVGVELSSTKCVRIQSHQHDMNVGEMSGKSCLTGAWKEVRRLMNMPADPSSSVHNRQHLADSIVSESLLNSNPQQVCGSYCVTTRGRDTVNRWSVVVTIAFAYQKEQNV